MSKYNVRGKTTGNEMALYWFARWYEDTEGHPYKFNSINDIARAAGLAGNTVGRILKTSKLVRLAGQQLIVAEDIT